MNFHELAADHSIDAIFIFNADDGSISYVNRTFSKIYGYHPNEILGGSTQILNGPQTTSASIKRLYSGIQKGLAFQIDLFQHRKNGDPLWIEAHLSPVHDSKGAITHWIAVHHPLNKRQNLQDSITRIADHLNLILENAPLVLWSADKNGNIKHATGKGLLAFQGPNTNLIEKSIFELLDEDKNSRELIKSILEGKTKHAILNLNGSFFDSYFAQLLDHKNEPIGTIAVSVDITERIQYEKDLLDAKEKAEEATRAKSEFLANVSHEIRTPLNVILGFSEILARTAEDTAHKKYTSAISTSGKNLLQLINDILDLSKIEANKLSLKEQPLNISDILNEIRLIFSIQCEQKSLSFEIDAPKEINSVLLDATRLRQVLFNLVGNAIKYTDEGSVQVSCKATNTNLKNNATTLVFEITDTGQGIKDEDQSIIFDSFIQKNQLKGGAGLGLAITRRLVDMMGGSIEVSSALNKGSTFKVTLPNIKTASNISISKAQDHDEQIDFKESTILIADDIEINLELIRAFLSTSNINIIEASDGYETLYLAEKTHPDLILLDLKMPGISGYDTAYRLKNIPQLKDIPIIAFTAQALEEDESKLKDSGFQAVLHKPITQATLIEALKKHLPYCKKENKSTEPSKKSPYSANPETLKTLINILKKKHLKQWKKICSSHVINEIKLFLKDLELVANQSQIPKLTSYTRDLKANLENYDISTVSNRLKEFPGLIDQLKQEYSKRITS